MKRTRRKSLFLRHLIIRFSIVKHLQYSRAICNVQRYTKRPPSPVAKRDEYDGQQQQQRFYKMKQFVWYLIILILCIETNVCLFMRKKKVSIEDDDYEAREGLLSFMYDGSWLPPLLQQAPTPITKLTKDSTGTAMNSFLNTTEHLVFDVISIGTLYKQELQQAQYETFASHPSVRNFYRMNERNDTDATCASQLSMDDFWSIFKICTRRDARQAYLTKLFQNEVIFHPKESTGWLCAQKRPIDGLYLALKRFLHGKNQIDLPHYLVMIDDDTYINMNYMTNILPDQYPYDERYLLTGCLFRSPKSITFLFPYGGFGSIFSRKALERMVQPIYCANNIHTSGNSYESFYRKRRNGMSPDDKFNDKACWRLQQNLIGEQAYFRDGMSILELMYAYSSNLKYTSSNEWGSQTNENNSDGPSFCFHSDQAFGYFLGFYHIGVPDHVWSQTLPVDISNYHQQDYPLNYRIKNDTLRIRYGYREIKRPGMATCKSLVGRHNRKHGKCEIGIDPFCHNFDATRMHDLYRG